MRSLTATTFLVYRGDVVQREHFTSDKVRQTAPLLTRAFGQPVEQRLPQEFLEMVAALDRLKAASL